MFLSLFALPLQHWGAFRPLLKVLFAMEEVCAEEEPLFQSLEGNLNEAEDGFTSALSRPLPKRRKYSYLLYGLIIAYLPALLLYAFLAFGFVVPKASSHAIDLNLFPCGVLWASILLKPY